MLTASTRYCLNNALETACPHLRQQTAGGANQKSARQRGQGSVSLLQNLTPNGRKRALPPCELYGKEREGELPCPQEALSNAARSYEAAEEARGVLGGQVPRRRRRCRAPHEVVDPAVTYGDVRLAESVDFVCEGKAG